MLFKALVGSESMEGKRGEAVEDVKDIMLCVSKESVGHSVWGLCLDGFFLWFPTSDPGAHSRGASQLQSSTHFEEGEIRGSNWDYFRKSNS